MTLITNGRRKTDTLCGALGRFWDFIDKRQIGQHFVSLAILSGTIQIIAWAQLYAQTHAPGGDVALTIAAVSAPYMALQTAAISFYFKALSK